MAEYVSVHDADFRARCWICGTTRDKDGKLTHCNGTWHERHHQHPWVRESETDGWGRELRSVVIANLTRFIFHAQQQFRHYPELETLMPEGKWIEYTRRDAKISRDALEWRAENAKNREESPSAGAVHLANVTRNAFRRMQTNSPNRMLHADHAAIARRILGEGA